ncbi:GRP family sugar transporter [Piscirickettsia litoralis]|uniref:GRP family sugar transporter n=1 Tax=Piscirickettsia litoralis TaxID=1891921 RepID=UPI000B2EE0FA|nr:GRP family sugar transporter [Piscirickettsia litoralis]
MLIINSYPLAVMLCIITMLCWGSWANTQKLASKSWSFQLYYWDYGFGVLIISFILAITLGSTGHEGRAFFTDLSQADLHNLWSAFLGGVIFNLANILLVAAIDIAGMAVAFPVGIGLALVIGVIVNYIGEPIGNPILLFLGVLAVAIAIIIDALAYKRLEAHNNNQKTVKGLIIAIIAGILMGFFYRFVANSMSMNFAHPATGKLTPYSATFIFSIGLVLSSFIWNSLMMKKPLTGEPIAFSRYFKEGNLKLHLIGMLGGAIWGLGTLLNFLAAGRAGAAISYGLGQGATMVAAIWGCLFGMNLKKPPKGRISYWPLCFCFT